MSEGTCKDIFEANATTTLRPLLFIENINSDTYLYNAF